MSDNDLWLSAVVELRPLAEADETPAEGEGDQGPPPVEPPVGISLDPGTTPHGGAGHSHEHKVLPMPAHEAKVARTKQFFTSSGFEVHAPVGRIFSIGGKRELFERFFGTTLDLQEDATGAKAVREGELTLDPLPEDIRAMVRSIFFLPPPAFPV